MVSLKSLWKIYENPHGYLNIDRKGIQYDEVTVIVKMRSYLVTVILKCLINFTGKIPL